MRRIESSAKVNLEPFAEALETYNFYQSTAVIGIFKDEERGLYRRNSVLSRLKIKKPAERYQP